MTENTSPTLSRADNIERLDTPTIHPNKPKIVQLVTERDADTRDAIELLEGFLAEARAGNITCVAIAALEPSGASRTRASSCGNVQAMLGAVSILHYRMFENLAVPADLPPR
jgi:hypothetical protein